MEHPWEKNNIALASVCDNYYVILLTALIKSIEINHVTSEKIIFYIIEDRVSLKNKKKLERSLSSGMIDIHWIQMSTIIPPDLKLPSDGTTYPMNVYMRLLIPNVISSEISKVIYLDVDLIFQQDVSLLWNISIEENIVAAVADQSIKMVSNYGGIANYEEFGLLETTKYFNSGVLIMDVKKWVSFNVAEKVIKCINANKKYVMWADQYGLNVVLANNWFELDLLWNYQAKFEGEDPFVIHFAGRKPIFKSYENKEIYQTIFFKYLKQTEWRGFEPIGEATRYFKKIKNILEKHL